MEVEIPGRGRLVIEHVVLDFNGTLALDGMVSAATEQLIHKVSQQYHVIVATADTFGTASRYAEQWGGRREIVQNGQDKEKLVASLGAGVCAIGNGANDRPMFQMADLAIAVMGGEGAAWESMSAADVVTGRIEDALALLLNPKRLVATLRR